MDIVTSRQNNRFKEIKELIDDKKSREETGNFFVDGVNFVAQAIANNWEVVTLIYVPVEIDTEYKKRVLSMVPIEKHFPIGASLYEILSVKKDIQGVGAVLKQRLGHNELLPEAGVVLENIGNPGNLGSIARLCAAFDIKNLYVIKPAVEFFHPEVVRSSMGGLFHLNLVEFDSIAIMEDALEKNSYFCLGTSLQNDSVLLTDYRSNMAKTKNQLIWFGSEAKGLTSAAKNLCQTLVQIPMHERADSLNVAESAAIVLYELFIKK